MLLNKTQVYPDKKNLLIRTATFIKKKIKLLGRLKALVEIICALLIILFLYTGVNKLWEYGNFKLQLGRSPFIQNLNGFIAATLPAGEILLSFLLVIPFTRLVGLYLSYILMGLFTGYIWLMLNYASDLPCSCGGILAELSWQDHFYFNAGFTVLSAIGIILQSKIIQRKRSLEP